MAKWKVRPLLQERIWGGRNLEAFGRSCPEGQKIGESWELVDRPEAQSVVEQTGQTLGSLWRGSERERIFGRRAGQGERFPILIKLLDAEEKLSLQVHPPAERAKELGGEPKTEMWFFFKDPTQGGHLCWIEKGGGEGGV